MTSRKYSDYYEGLKKNVQGNLGQLDRTCMIHTLLNLILIAQMLCLRLNTPSPYTKEELKSYKNLKGQIVGWVGIMSVYPATPDGCTHCNCQTLPSIVAAEKLGTICDHCTCMKGLGEACSHTAALLLAAEAHTRYIRSVSYTSMSCRLLPLSMQNVTYTLFPYEFVAPSTKRRKMLKP